MNKVIRWVFPVLILLGACSSEKKFTVSGTLKGLEQKMLYLQKFEENKPVTFDSVQIGDDGSFKLAAAIPYTDYYRLFVSEQNNFVFIADPVGHLIVEADGVLNRPTKIEGQEDTRLMHEFTAEMDKLMIKREQIIQLSTNGTPKEQVASLMTAFTNEALSYIHGFVDKHASSPAVLAALNNLNPMEDMPYFIKVRDSLEKRMGESAYYTFLKTQISEAETQLGEQQGNESGQLAVGKPAPEITLPDPSGKNHSLSELKGKVVLIDFWASWCGPCRQENPNVVKAYNQFKDKGFEIFSVSLDKSKSAWVNAIQEDGLHWTHVSDLQYWSSAAAATYGVTSIPFTVLVDQQGNIVAKNLRGEALVQKLKEILG